MMEGCETDEDLERLIQENLALQAENEALRLETKEHAVTFQSDDEPVEPTPDSEAAWLQVQVEALRREGEALQNVLCLAEELQALQRTNIALREAEGQLREENSFLQAENTTLQAASPPAIGSRAAAPAAASMQRRGVEPQAPKGSLDRRVHQLTVSLGHGDQDVLANCNQQQRKEIVAAMLKAGLFDPLGEEQRTGASAGLATTAPTYGVAAAVADGPPVSAPSSSKQRYVQPAASNAQSAQKGAASNAQKVAAPAPTGSAGPRISAPVAKAAAPAPTGSAGPRISAPVAAQQKASAALAAPVDAGAMPWPVSMGVGQDVAEALKRGDDKALNSLNKEQKKELIANMLKTGVFCAPPGPITATAADERAMDLPQEKSSYSRDLQMKQLQQQLIGLQPCNSSDIRPLAGSRGAVTEMEDDRRMSRYAKEMAIKGKLESIRAASQR